VAVDDVRVRAGQLDQRLEQYKPGNRVRVTVARRDLLRSIDVTLGAAPGTAWSLAIRPDAGAAHKARFTAWTGESAE
jgi:predicted metalloprotease with PDZ domain